MKCFECPAKLTGSEMCGSTKINVCAAGHRTGSIPLTAEMRAFDASRKDVKTKRRKLNPSEEPREQNAAVSYLLGMPNAANDR